MIHVVIPDTQVKPGVPTEHLEWAGRYIVDKFKDRDDVRVIHLGDHWDMPSLSSYDKGRKSMEGRRVKEDVAAGDAGFKLLNEPMEYLNSQRRARGRKEWWPDRHFLLGNHENRITRAVEADAQLEGVLSLDMLDTRGWQVHPFLEVVELDGVLYSHYFYHPMTGTPYGGTVIETRIKNIGASFTQGHQQTLMHGLRFVRDRSQHGLVCGSFYQHDEDYKGPQGNAHWRGIIVCHQVDRGSYDLMTVSLDYLRRRYAA
ncbi:MAG TPA: hypothetical protein VGQ42_15735 [Candidatus Dormibacteraeota bacterium]|jgi:hypothetical protein|nr:hypothetical protein [Candidatus Dormibacteraeota bacterium]